jgi:hypothetical protein
MVSYEILAHKLRARSGDSMPRGWLMLSDVRLEVTSAEFLNPLFAQLQSWSRFNFR